MDHVQKDLIVLYRERVPSHLVHLRESHLVSSIFVLLESGLVLFGSKLYYYHERLQR
jgi:hypothetical protein